MVKNDPQYKTLDGLKTHPMFQLLTLKQQVFVITYIETNCDKVKAVTAAGFITTKPDVVAMRQMRSTYVRKLLSIYYGYDLEQSRMTRTELSGLIAARLRKPNLANKDFAKLADQMMELNWQKRGPGRPTKQETKDSTAGSDQTIDGLVRQIEKERKLGVV
jgi:hypothetical protein